MNYKSGYSFMEVTIATLIIGVIGAFVASCMPITLVSGEEAQEVSKATDLAQRYMETVKSELSYQSNFDNLSEGTNPPIAITSDFTHNGTFTVKTLITDIDTALVGANTIPVLREIDVEYQRASDSAPILGLSTLISRPE